MRCTLCDIHGRGYGPTPPCWGTHVNIQYRQVNLYDEKAASDEAGTINEEPSMTVQDQAEDADINTIVRRFGLTGTLPPNPRLPEYGDFTGVNDYRTAIEAVREADARFMELPPDIRSRFENNPQRLIEASHEQLQDAGLLPRPAPSEPPPAAPPGGAQAPAGQAAGGGTGPN